MDGYSKVLEQGMVVAGAANLTQARIGEKVWNPSPACAGVSLKHLLTGEETGGAMSLHLVRIDPGCAIGSHVHEHNWELHQVVHGQGSCQVCGQRVDYRPGVQTSLPKGRPHEVHAGDDGLVLMATFSPPLV